MRANLAFLFAIGKYSAGIIWLQSAHGLIIFSGSREARPSVGR